MQVQIYNNLEYVNQIYRLQFTGYFQSELTIGQLVTPQTMIMEGSERKIVGVLDIAQALQVAPDQVENYLTVSAGALVQEDDVVAEKKMSGRLKLRQVRSPAEGIVMLDKELGRLRIESSYEEGIQKEAGVWGRIKNITSNSIVIEAEALKIYTLWGIGEEVCARMVKLPSSVKSWSKRVGGKIVYVDRFLTYKVYQRLVSLGVVGIIANGLNWNEYKLFFGAAGLDSNQAFPVPILILSGWGTVKLPDYLAHLIKLGLETRVCLDGSNHNLVISLSLERYDTILSRAGIRIVKQIIYYDQLRKGDRVRLIDGRIGQMADFVDDAYIKVKIGGKIQVINQEEALKVVPQIKPSIL